MRPDPPPTYLTEFTCFPRLPLELRCAIWKASMERRVVEINYDLPDGFYSTVKYPEALSVCHESRKALIPHYPLCFGTIFHPSKTRFNFDLDTLFIDNSFEEEVPHLFSAFGEKERKGLKYVAVDSYFNGSDDDVELEFVVHMRRAMRCLEGLAELQIVFDIQVLSGRTFGCGQEDHAIEIHEKLPAELAKPQLGICALPVDVEEFDLWKVKKVKPVYGWRKCPVGFNETDVEATGDRYAPWGMPRDGESFWDMMGHSDYDDDESHLEDESLHDAFDGGFNDGDTDLGETSNTGVEASEDGNNADADSLD